MFAFDILFFLMFIFDRERDRAWVGKGQREREGDTESETGSRLRAVSTEPDAGLELTDREIMTWAEVRCSTDWATQAPLYLFYNKENETIIYMGSQKNLHKYH